MPTQNLAPQHHSPEAFSLKYQKTSLRIFIEVDQNNKIP
jgi:hypothetical protein